MGGQDAVAAEDHEAILLDGDDALRLRWPGVHNSSSFPRGCEWLLRPMRARRQDPRCPPPIRWARSRATTISPPTFSTAISRPAAPSKPAFIDPRGTWTYGQLADRVARFAARAARARHAARGARADLRCSTPSTGRPPFSAALKAGVVAVPVNTLMTEDDYRFMLADSRARMLVVSEALYPKFAEADRRSRRTSSMSSCRATNAHGHKRFEDLIDGGEAGAAHRADHARRHRVLALHLGLDRQAEGRGACACRPQADQRSLRRADPRHHRERRLLFGGEAVLRLWARQRA